jgi:hypothetical protein
MTDATPPSMAEIEYRAVVDPEFRSALIADPRGALVGLGVPLADDVTVTPVPAGPSEFVLELPPPVTGDLDLSDGLLRDVGGAGAGLLLATIAIPAGSFLTGFSIAKLTADNK